MTPVKLSSWGAFAPRYAQRGPSMAQQVTFSLTNSTPKVPPHSEKRCISHLSATPRPHITTKLHQNSALRAATQSYGDGVNRTCQKRDETCGKCSEKGSSAWGERALVQARDSHDMTTIETRQWARGNSRVRGWWHPPPGNRWRHKVRQAKDYTSGPLDQGCRASVFRSNLGMLQLLPSRDRKGMFKNGKSVHVEY